MAEHVVSATEQELLGIKHLLWGNEIKKDIFNRWAQGFNFSQSESSALEQIHGGPCAIIAPVQGFILKKLLLDYRDLAAFRNVITPEIQNSLLVTALTEILAMCNQHQYYIVYLDRDTSNASSEVVNQLSSPATSPPLPPTDSTIPMEAVAGPTAASSTQQSSTTNPVKHSIQEANPVEFHQHLRIATFSSIADVSKYFVQNVDSLKGSYGILLFLYSVIATRGMEQVRAESDTQDPLIDETYGYGSQSLINLMITGRATTYVWDHEQDVGGLKLKGVEKQSQIGFLTIMEHLRFCSVGSFFKNPIHPVWVLGSDTHLTVLFSDERRLVSPETKSEQARRVFKCHDPDGNNFINASLLQNVLSELDLVSEPDYVNIIRKKLDSENLGIILLNAFMDEFFPKEESSTPDMFTLIHYNGLAQSNVNGQVQYHIGSAILLESDLKSICESNSMLTVLQTKWPNIEVNWCDDIVPSLN